MNVLTNLQIICHRNKTHWIIEICDLVYAVSVHYSGLNSVLAWMLLCPLESAGSALNCLEQTLHWYDLSPVWMRKCDWRLPKVVNLLGTNITFVGFFSSMYTHVCLQMAKLCELFGTDIAFVGFFSSMYTHVCSQTVPDSVNCFSTNIAFIGFFSSVVEQMSF